jgi:hypothetical protein
MLDSLGASCVFDASILYAALFAAIRNFADSFRLAQ